MSNTRPRYEIWLERASQRDLKRLTAQDFDRVIRAIKSLSDNPRPHGARKITGSEHDWRIRVGSLRVIYEIDDRQKLVKVMKIRHRKEVYR